MKTKNLTVRLDPQTLDKLHYIASYEARSANGQVQILIKRCIEQFEKEHGEIKIGGKKTENI